MKFIGRFIVLALIAGILWYVYGERFEESGLAGVYKEMQADFIEVSNHPLVISGADKLREGILFVTERISVIGENEEEQQPEIEKPDLTAPVEQSFSIRNIELGDHRDEVEAETGEPKRRSHNDYGVNWVAYHDGYQNFVMAAYDKADRVIGLYTNQDLLRSESGITFSSTRDEVLASLPDPLTVIKKGPVHFRIQDSGEYNLFAIDESYVTVFYDKHESSKVTAILIIDKELENSRTAYFAGPDEDLQAGFEYQLFDLTNAARVKHGLAPLNWEESARWTARAHSADMAENNYFSHTNLEGQSPFDRLSEDAVSYSMAGENIAAGQPSSIFAHEGLMNSLGHRENKLNRSYQSLAVGVAFNEDRQPFYTENYLAR